MPKQVWNVALRRYEMVPDGVQIAGTSFTNAQVIAQKVNPLIAGKILDFSRASIVTDMLKDGYSASSWKELADEMVDRVKASMPKKETWEGKQGYIEWVRVDANYRAALKNLIDTDDPAPGHDRGLHATNPMKMQGNPTEIREYDLSAAAAGRVTRITQKGVKAYYMSIHHAAATYQYYLLLHDGKPVLRGSLDGVNKVALP